MDIYKINRDSIILLCDKSKVIALLKAEIDELTNNVSSK